MLARRSLRKEFAQIDVPDRIHAKKWICNYIKSPMLRNKRITFNPYTYKYGKGNDEVIFYIHGGGLVYYDNDIFDTLASRISDFLKLPVFLMGYKKAPENDACVLLTDLINRITSHSHAYEKIWLFGDSIGGLIALYIATNILYKKTSRVTLFYPVLSTDHYFPSYELFGKHYYLTVL